MLRSLAFTLVLAAALQAQERTPVLLELFTSEGCSSCPSADSLLADLEKKQPVPGANVIVLSEHVDYWNRTGWKDPYSSALFSQRQQSYATAMHAEDVYTPQAMVDGHYSTVGSNRPNLIEAITGAARKAKTSLDIHARREGNTILVDVPAVGSGETWIALTQGRAHTFVEAGENSGRSLKHVGVVRSLTKASPGTTRLTIDKNWDSDLRVVAFVQEAHMGRILQAVQQTLPKLLP